MTTFVERAAAKVNLTLRVVGKRADGYHALESLVAFAGAPADIVTLDLALPAGVLVTGPGAGAIVGENLIAKAIDKARAVEPGLRAGGVTLEKHLPVAAGIGGGSADAAATLRALQRANPGYARTIDWAKIALSLGADVPVCLASRPAFMWGIGGSLAHMPGLPKLPAVIVNPLAPVPADKTAQVFRRLGAARIPDGADEHARLPGPFADAAALVAYMREIGNDLETPAMAVVPQIADVKAALAQSEGCLIAQLSGGGPTCFGIYASTDAAAAAAAAIGSTHPAWWIAATVLG